MPLIIRAAQMQAFEAAQERSLIEELRQAMVSAYPERCRELGEKALEEILWKGYARARSYGLLTVGEIAGFLELSITLKPEFDEDPAYAWAARILKMSKLRGAAKIARIQTLLAREKEAPDGAA
jgi:hypothetical protein